MEHTKGLMAIHFHYANEKPHTFESGGEMKTARNLPLVAGETIIGEARFMTGNCGWPVVDNEAEMLANARRMVACWNACEGITTEELEQNGAKVNAHIFKLTQHRADLLEALRELLDSMDANGSCQYETLRAAGRDAIARAEGSNTTNKE